MSTPAPRKRLPVNPSSEHLRKQAKRLAARADIPLAEAQHRLARDYGSDNWPELMRVVASMAIGADQLHGDSHRTSPLADAANRTDLAAVRRILAEDEFTQHDLDLALARAVIGFVRRRAIAELLIEHGADPNGQYGGNYGPIVLATGECLDPDGLAFLIEHGADVAFAPIASKYGPTSPLISTLGTYVRNDNDDKHRCIDVLLRHGAVIPEAVTPAMLAVHRGDAAALAALVDADPGLAARRFPDMPYGNLPVAGGTLLHLAVELVELECLDLLLERGADPAARAQPRGDLGDQSPVFHAIGTNLGAGRPALQRLVARAGTRIDWSARARFKVFDDVLPAPMTPLEYARWAADPARPDFCRASAEDVAAIAAAGGGSA